MIPNREDYITLTGVHSGNYVYYQDYIDLYMAAEKQEQQIKELRKLLSITSSWKDEMSVTHELRKRIGEALNQE